MIQRNIPYRARRNRPGRRRALIPVAMAAGLLLCAAPGARAQTDDPLPPPASAPQSRLIITPAEFERWMAGNPPDTPEVAATEPPGPQLVAPPPPEPMLVAPPPPVKLAPIRPIAPTPETAGPAATPVTPELTPAPPPESPVTVQTPPPAAPTATTPDLTPPAAAPAPTSPPVAPTPPERQVATLPPDSPGTPAAGEPRVALPELETIPIPFAVEETELSEGARTRLNEIAVRLKERPEVRVQIVGYASELAQTKGQARRRSLYRVISVREYLVGQGVLSTRMDVRALGDKSEDQSRDRVDVIIPPS